MSDARRFSPLLCKLVADRFGLSPDEVSNLEMADEGEDVDRDLNGIDAVLHFPTSGESTVAFRTRLDDPRFEVDFSLRTVSRNNTTESEWHKLKRAYLGDEYEGEIADYYCFARTRDARITDCYLMRTEWLMDVLWGEGGDPEGEYEERASENGGSARYVPVEDISRAVVAELE
ncbi:hypothetical protein OB920_13330 [Halobacteria archaeon HArc-gm2]|nr:hypothetical protein [Halobacteria archaeon HArc-gm2]